MNKPIDIENAKIAGGIKALYAIIIGTILATSLILGAYYGLTSKIDLIDQRVKQNAKDIDKLQNKDN